MRSKIAIDARYADPPMSGIGRYTINLLAGITQGRTDRRFTVLLSDQSSLPASIAQSDRFEFLIMPRSPAPFRDQCILPFLLTAHGISLLHSPDAFAPLLWPGKLLITIHDLIPLLFRSRLYAGVKSRFAPVWRTWLRLQCMRASGIVTVSESSAADLRRLLPASERKIRAIHNGITPVPRPGKEERLKFRMKYSLEGKFILYVGRRDPTKNLALLVKSFALLRSRRPEDNLKLVIAGQPDCRYREAELEAEKLGIASFVIHTGYLDERTLSACYCEAAVFTLPSLCEGFGFPALEAMHYGIPTVVSNIPVFVEVFGDAVLRADPLSPEAWADAMESLFADDRLVGVLKRCGEEKAACLTAQAQASRTLDLYEQILSTQGQDKTAAVNRAGSWKK